MALVQSELSFSRPTDDTLLIRLAGSWRVQDMLPSASELLQQLDSPPSIRRIRFDATPITAWDSGLLTFLIKLGELSAQKQIEVDRGGLPAGHPMWP